MAPTLSIFFTILFSQVLTSTAQSSLKQYLHVAGINPHSLSGLTNLPTVGYTRQVPSGVTTYPSGGIAAVPNSGVSNVPNSGLAALGALASIPGLLQTLTSASASPQPAPSTGVPTLKTQAFQSTNQPSSSPPSVPTSKQNAIATNSSNSNGGLDSAVLNNLAIALQLLIVSNILNSNLPENEANPIYEMLETVKNIPVSLSQAQSYSYPSSSSTQGYQEPNFVDFQSFNEQSHIPNVNFVGTSGFTEATITDPYIKPTSRNSYQLMSPYEALGPNSPFTDPILGSAYGSVMSSKKDFHSPYVMMDNDPFHMNDLF